MNQTEKHTIKNAFNTTLEMITFLLVMVSFVLIGVYYNQLPESIPIYFNDPATDENGLGVKSLLWTIPILSALLVIGIYKLNQSSWLFNYQTKFNRENAVYNHKITAQMLRILALAFALMSLSIVLSSILNGLGNSTDFEPYIYPFFPIVLTAIPILYLLKVVARKVTKHNNE